MHSGLCRAARAKPSAHSRTSATQIDPSWVYDQQGSKSRKCAQTNRQPHLLARQDGGAQVEGALLLAKAGPGHRGDAGRLQQREAVEDVGRLARLTRGREGARRQTDLRVGATRGRGAAGCWHFGQVGQLRTPDAYKRTSSPIVSCTVRKARKRLYLLRNAATALGEDRCSHHSTKAATPHHQDMTQHHPRSPKLTQGSSQILTNHTQITPRSHHHTQITPHTPT